MLNPAFSNQIGKTKDFKLPEKYQKLIVQDNSSFNTGPEKRLQSVYGDELWLKINDLLPRFDWQSSDVLDVCCGTGFLSYHLLKKVQPKNLTLVDISKHEVDEAKALIGGLGSKTIINYEVADVLKYRSAKKFDLVIGNSFLHHFYDLPLAIRSLKSLLKPGGTFVSLHEPTPAAIAIEDSNKKRIAKNMVMGSRYIAPLRFSGDGVTPGHSADVWLFSNSDIKKLFGNEFKYVKLSNWHMMRSYKVAKGEMHLSSSLPKLTKLQENELRKAVKFDSVARKILPRYWFGSVSVKASNEQV